MATWKKIITSGSNADLNQITASAVKFPNDSISGDLVSGGTIGTTTITALAGNISIGDNNITNVGSIDVDELQDDATGGDTKLDLTGTALDIDVGGSQILETTATTAKFSVPIETTSHITASGNISSSGDITANGLMVGKQYQTYVCSFNDDMGTVEHGIPWGSTFENAFQADETVAFVVPCNTNVKHILLRGQGFDQNLLGGFGSPTPTINFSIKTHAPYGTAITTEGNWTTKEIATVQAPASVDTGATNLTYARFSGSHAQGGDAVFIGMTFSADFANGSDEYYVTVVMEHDYNTLPVIGSSQRAMVTGSVADGGGFGG